MATVRELITKISFRYNGQGLQRAQNAVNQLLRNLRTMNRAQPRINVQADTNRAELRLQRIRQQLQQMQEHTIRVRSQGGLRGGNGGAGGNGVGSGFMGALGIGGMSAGAMAGTALAAGVAAAGAAAVSATKQFATFDATMSKVKALTNATDADMKTLTDTARRLGASTKYSATEAAEAMTFLGMAGWKTQEITSAMPGLLSLAAASGTDLATTADIVSDDLTAFHMSADKAGHMADVMAVASTNANTNVNLMGMTFKYAGAVAGSLGYSLEDVALATGLMANAGIKGEMAGTALRSTMTRMIDPPKDAAAALAKLGVSATRADGSVKPFRQQLQELRKAFAKLTKAEQAEAASSIAGLEAMSGFLSVVTASEADFNKLANAIDNADGAAEKSAATMNDNLIGSLKELQSQAEETALVFGERFEKPVREAVNGIKKTLHEATNAISTFFAIYDGPKENANDPLMQFSGPDFYEAQKAQHPVMTQLAEFFHVIADNADKSAKAMDNLSQSISKAFGDETVIKGAQLIIDALTALAKFQGKSIDDIGGFAFTPMGQAYEIGKTVYGAIFDLIASAIEKIGDLVIEGVKKLGELANAVANTASEMIKSFGSAVTQVNTLFSGMADSAISNINRIMDGLVQLELKNDALRIKIGETARMSKVGDTITNNYATVSNRLNVSSEPEASAFARNSIPYFGKAQ